MGAEAERQFVDTNVLVYAHDTTAGAKCEQARKLVADLWAEGNGCLSVQVLQEFYVTVTRKVRQPLDPAIASQLVADLAHWLVHSPNADDVVRAIALHQRYSLSFWDAMILVSAAQMKCAIVWSEDLRSGEDYSGVRALNPFV